jgi:MFS family permease
MNTFSATTTLATDLFALPSALVTLNYLIFPISATLFSPLINWLITKHGIRTSYYLAAALMLAGVWLRTSLSHDNPYLCLLGSLLAAIACNFLMNSASKLTTHWFRTDIANLVTFFSVLINILSASVSLFLPGLFLNSKSTEQEYINFLRY